MTITIGGKEYAAHEPITLLKVRHMAAYENQLAKLDEELVANPDIVDYDKRYADLWLKMCACYIQGDVSALGVDKLGLRELGELRSFFTRLLESQKPTESSESLNDTPSNK